MKQTDIKINICSFNFIKGLLLILLIIGHSLSVLPVNMIITDNTSETTPWMVALSLIKYCTNPLFFMCCGFGIKERPIKKALTVSFKQYIYPYIKVAVCVAVLFPIVHFLFFRDINAALSESVRYDLAFLFGISDSGIVTMFGVSLYWCSAVHFLLDLFIATNLVNLILRIKNEILQLIVSFMLSILGMWLQGLGFVYFCIPMATFAVFFCYAGHAIKKHNVLNILNAKKYLIVIILVLSAACMYAASAVSFPLIFQNLCITGISVVVIYFSALIGQSEARFLDPIKFFGMHSLWILCAHSVEMVVIPWYLVGNKYLPDNILLALAVIVIFRSCIIWAGCYLIQKVSRLKHKKNLQKQSDTAPA